MKDFNFTMINHRARLNGWIVLVSFSLIISAMAQSFQMGEAFIQSRAAQQAIDLQEVVQPAINPEELIRFHVVANSDSEEDQALKRAVRDAILKEVSPRLAASKSLDESREILKALRPEMEAISQTVIQSWGRNYSVKSDYGQFIFPTKSYGSLILPAGEYEAVRILIGEAKGSNWWCVLFPPLCFVDIEHSTAVAVDGKPGIPYDEKNSLPNAREASAELGEGGKDSAEFKEFEEYKESVELTETTGLTETKGAMQSKVSADDTVKESAEKPEVRFWLADVFKQLF